ncbi:MAG: ATP-binding protein, partial [Planctomycetota bacterium]
MRRRAAGLRLESYPLGTGPLLTALCATVLLPAAVLLALAAGFAGSTWSPWQEAALNSFLVVLTACCFVRSSHLQQVRVVVARLGGAFLIAGVVVTFLRLAGVLANPQLLVGELMAKCLGALMLVIALGRWGRRIAAEADAASVATLRSTFNSIAEPLVVLDHDCRIQEVNWYGELRFSDSVPGKTVCESSVFQRDSCEGCPVGACFEQNRPQFFTVQRSPSEQSVDFAAIPVSVNATEAHRQVLRLRTRRGRPGDVERLHFLDDVISSVSEAVVGLDRSHRITAMNRQARSLLGEAERESVGQEILSRLRFAAPADRGRFEAFLESDQKAELELMLRTVDGRTAHSVICSDPLLQEDGTRTGTALIFRDVTENRKYQEMLRHSERMSSLGLFVSGLAHELNNPVTAILGALKALRGGQSRVDRAGVGQNDALDVIMRNAEQCRRVVSSLLRLARNERSGMRPLDPEKVVQDTVDLLGRSLAQDRILLKVSCEPGVGQVSGDPDQLQQVLMNLIANARDSIHSRSEGGTIALRARERNGRCLLEVEDDGAGIEPGLESRLFKEFCTTKRVGEGTGLGLFISSAIIREHGGTLTAAAGHPRGALFTVSLPI